MSSTDSSYNEWADQTLEDAQDYYDKQDAHQEKVGTESKYNQPSETWDSDDSDSDGDDGSE